MERRSAPSKSDDRPMIEAKPVIRGFPEERLQRENAPEPSEPIAGNSIAQITAQKIAQQKPNVVDESSNSDYARRIPRKKKKKSGMVIPSDEEDGDTEERENSGTKARDDGSELC